MQVVSMPLCINVFMFYGSVCLCAAYMFTEPEIYLRVTLKILDKDGANVANDIQSVALTDYGFASLFEAASLKFNEVMPPFEPVPSV